MHSYSLLGNAPSPVYYSLVLPTLQESIEQPLHAPTVISDLRNIVVLMKHYQDARQQAGQIEKRESFPNQILFEFFQNGEDAYKEIQPIKNIILQDSQLLLDQTNFPYLPFCYTSRFFRGCIRSQVPGRLSE